MPLPKVSFLSVAVATASLYYCVRKLERFPPTHRAVYSVHFLGKEVHWDVDTRGPVKPSHIRIK